MKALRSIQTNGKKLRNCLKIENLNDWGKVKPRGREVLIKTISSGVNPIDVWMAQGYGRTLLGPSFEESRWTPFGREVYGTVMDCGDHVYDVCRGDRVVALLPVFNPTGGGHAQYSMADEETVVRIPKNFTQTTTVEENNNNNNNIGLGCSLYAQGTALQAWNIFNVNPNHQQENRRIFIHGAEGAVGRALIQIIGRYSPNTQIIASHRAKTTNNNTSNNNIYWINTFNRDKQEWGEEILNSIGSIDFVLDAVGDLSGHGETFIVNHHHKNKTNNNNNNNKHNEDHKQSSLEVLTKIMSKERTSKFVTLHGNMLRDMDDYGLIGGSIYGMEEFYELKKGYAQVGVDYNWLAFWPNRKTLTELIELYENNTLKLVGNDQIHSFPIDKAIDAYELVKSGGLKGDRIVILPN